MTENLPTHGACIFPLIEMDVSIMPGQPRKLFSANQAEFVTSLQWQEGGGQVGVQKCHKRNNFDARSLDTVKGHTATHETLFCENITPAGTVELFKNICRKYGYSN